ncbi:MAG TPA: sugar transferase [Longimicrobiales bacterium]
MDERPLRASQVGEPAAVPSTSLEIGLEDARRGFARDSWLPTSWEVQDRLCRVMSVVVALAALVVSIPVLVVLALLVRLTSPGPVLYTQMRVGVDRRRRPPGPHAGRRRVNHGGKLFRIYKFRTMYVDAGDGVETWATPDDPRVTPLGRVLRRTRLDELPQLFNVLRGDMNIVGPRPEQPGIFGVLREQIERYGERQRVLPGMTGLAQVHQSYDTTLDDVRRKLRYDLEYIERRSVMEDLRIMLRTVPVVFFRRGGW